MTGLFNEVDKARLSVRDMSLPLNVLVSGRPDPGICEQRTAGKSRYGFARTTDPATITSAMTPYTLVQALLTSGVNSSPKPCPSVLRSAAPTVW